MMISENFLEKALESEQNDKDPPCKCYPACFSIDYGAETTQATYEWWKFETTNKVIAHLESKHLDEEIKKFLETFGDYLDDDDDDSIDVGDEKVENSKNDDDTKIKADVDDDNEENGEGNRHTDRLMGEDEELHKMHRTSLKIFFKDYQFIPTERSELYGFSDFVANCGGLLGLFTGFSFLSLMEICYYLTIRAWINKYLFGRFMMETPADPDQARREKKKREEEK